MKKADYITFKYFYNSFAGIYLYNPVNGSLNPKDCKELLCYQVQKGGLNSFYFYAGPNEEKRNKIVESFKYYSKLLGLDLEVSVEQAEDMTKVVDSLIYVSGMKDILVCEAAAILIRSIMNDSIFLKPDSKIEDLFVSKLYFFHPLVQKVFLNWKGFHAGVTEDQRNSLGYNFDYRTHGGLVNWASKGIFKKTN